MFKSNFKQRSRIKMALKNYLMNNAYQDSEPTVDLRITLTLFHVVEHRESCINNINNFKFVNFIFFIKLV